jgi:hypothetical protein
MAQEIKVHTKNGRRVIVPKLGLGNEAQMPHYDEPAHYVLQ